jgi:regulator of sirC expression with transglutaminase-like and TPR domain
MQPVDFSEAIERKPLHLPTAALALARQVAYPNLDTGYYLSLMDELIDQAKDAVPTSSPVDMRGEALVDFLFGELRFQGNSGEYNDPRNSYLNDVLDRRLGIPITLSILYIEIAQRLEIPAYGIGLPGHFIVGIDTDDRSFFIDPFHAGRRLSMTDCVQMVELTTGYDGTFKPEWLQPVKPEDILARMLNNLRLIYLQNKTWEKALIIVELFRLVKPDSIDYLRDLGLIYHNTGSLHQAVALYEQYLQKAPDAPDFEAVKRNYQLATAYLARIN